jgi:hypothetical protein
MIACVTPTIENLSASYSVGPEGYKIIWGLAALLAPVMAYLVWKKVRWNGLIGRGRRRKPGISELSLSLTGEPEFRPIVLYLRITNDSGRTIDVEAPVIVFKRWRSSRKFRIRTVNEAEIYPILLDPGQSHELSIQLEAFYRKESVLRMATRVRVEVGEVNGGIRLRSRSLRLKRI